MVVFPLSEFYVEPDIRLDFRKLISTQHYDFQPMKGK